MRTEVGVSVGLGGIVGARVAVGMGVAVGTGVSAERGVGEAAICVGVEGGWGVEVQAARIIKMRRRGEMEIRGWEERGFMGGFLLLNVSHRVIIPRFQTFE